MSRPWTPASAIQDWRDTLDLAARIGAPTGARFAEYLRILETVRELELAPDRRAAFAPFRRDERNLRLLYEGAGQMTQLVLASRVWNRLDPALLARKLRTVMKGDPMPEQRGKEDHARDTLVELLAASLLTEVGFSPSITENEADVELTGHGFNRVVVECKRPTSIRSALAASRHQLWKRTRRGEDLGIPVFAIECARDLPFKRFMARSEQDVDDAVVSMFDDGDRIVRALHYQPEGHYRISKVAPILLFVVSGAVLLDDSRKTHVYNFTSVRQCALPDGKIPLGLDDALSFERRDGSLLSDFR